MTAISESSHQSPQMIHTPKLPYLVTSLMTAFTPGSHPLKSFASLVHSLLRNEMHLWTAIYTVRNEHCLEAYVSVCYSIIREMEITLFPPTNEQGKDVTKISKSKPFNDFGSSQISKQVRCPSVPRPLCLLALKASTNCFSSQISRCAVTLIISRTCEKHNLNNVALLAFLLTSTTPMSLYLHRSNDNILSNFQHRAICYLFGSICSTSSWSATMT